MKYIYPVIFKDDDGKIGVEVPDIPNCYTFGDDMADAMDMAKDVIEMLLVNYENEGKPIPKPSEIKDIKTDGIISLIKADTMEWRKNFDNKAVKKTLTIPSWLNFQAEKEKINFSNLLQEALLLKLNITD
jgi:predicted RNase H-like HicB family nuclease